MINTGKSKKIRAALCLIIVLSLGGVWSVFAGYRRMMNSAGTMTAAVGDGADMAISRIHQTATRDGVTEWRLDAASASLINARAQAVFQTPSVTFFLEDQRQIVLTAQKGAVDTESNDINVTGQVVMKNGGYRLETDALRYRHDARIFLSDTPVKLTGKSFDLSADGASFDITSQQVVFKGNVKGTFVGNGITL
ncbi:LPS export ABC transporter periplasmic protein L ptC [Desulfonema ishimotonii]|uniref:LPS export ABC transporter periplasmic protein L ptC n=1 Tax=Desulfonema ishimotonii TaxID=45657 RepID=A0A401G083_9BACT|nr:LPS export ABC transporter periplasmic protein LptC [Desulfonema ishimotonii]GBC62628.1 LPS export ABC transporter periplasmic protein L ptC [Desulfonema ishimotonii]